MAAPGYDHLAAAAACAEGMRAMPDCNIGYLSGFEFVERGIPKGLTSGAVECSAQSTSSLVLLPHLVLKGIVLCQVSATIHERSILYR